MKRNAWLEEYLIWTPLWTDTDDLASKVKHKLKNVSLDKEIIKSYVAEVSKILSSNLDSRELAYWRRFVVSVYENIDIK